MTSKTEDETADADETQPQATGGARGVSPRSSHTWVPGGLRTLQATGEAGLASRSAPLGRPCSRCSEVQRAGARRQPARAAAARMAAGAHHAARGMPAHRIA